jgi:hypothetical protein
LSTAAIASATVGDSARVPMLVAIALAASWKPFVKSKISAITTTAMSNSETSDTRHPGRRLEPLPDWPILRG